MGRYRVKSTIRILICASAAWCFAVFAHAYAQDVPPTCDADYYSLLGAKGYLEGKREMEAAQRIILKADSVLEYSCFHLDIESAGEDGATFSVGNLSSAIIPPEFDGGINIPSASMSHALDSVVYGSLIEFLYSFQHTFGGGSYPAIPTSKCNPMNVVWHVAKCDNFDPTTWVTLEDLADNDIRLYPTPCDDSNDPGRKTRIETAYDVVTIDPAAPPASGSMEEIDWFTDEVTGECSSSMAISTGVQVKLPVRQGEITFDEAVCIKPGCSFTGLGGSCE